MTINYIVVDYIWYMHIAYIGIDLCNSVHIGFLIICSCVLLQFPSNSFEAFVLQCTKNIKYDTPLQHKPF